MSNISIIIQREYAIRVRKKSFLILTLLVPILFIGLVTLPMILGQMGIDTKEIAILDKTGIYEGLFEDNAEFHFTKATKSIEAYKSSNKKAEGIDAVLEIRQDLLEDPKAIALYGYSQLPSSVSSHINSVLSNYLSDEKLMSYNIDNIKQILADSKVSININTYKWGEDGSSERTSGELAQGISMVFMFVIFMLIMTLAGTVQAGVLEEKKNRIMEVMVSSTKPFDLMMGKIIGIGLVGITQLICWVLLTTILFLVAQFLFLGNLYSAEAIQSMQASQVSGMAAGFDAESFKEMQDMMSIISGISFTKLILSFFIYFIGGYMLFASIFAVIASMVSSDEDTTQFMMPVTLLMLFGFYAAFGSMNNPEGTLAFWCSLIPFTSPFVMMVRLPYDVPFWQMALSVSLLYGCFILMVYLGAKIYRVGVLMYGKKPSLKEIAHWLRYK